MATIDERLEALTHSLELVADMQIKTEEKIAEVAVSMNGLTLAMRALAQAHIEHSDAINRLALIVGNHEDRIDDLEGK